MITECYVAITVKCHNRKREYDIVDAINATEDFYVEEHYSNGDRHGNHYYYKDYDVYGEPCRCISAVCQSMPEYEIDDSVKRLIDTIRAVNRGYCVVEVVTPELLPEPKCFRRKRRNHKRQQRRRAA